MASAKNKGKRKPIKFNVKKAKPEKFDIRKLQKEEEKEEKQSKRGLEVLRKGVARQGRRKAARNIGRR